MTENINHTSKYYDLDELCDVLTETSNHLSVMSANSRSLLKHTVEYQALFDYLISRKSFKFDILCFVESWLNCDNCNLAHFDGYSHVMKLKTSTSRGGGLSIFIEENVKYVLRNDLNLLITLMNMIVCLLKF